MVIMITIIRDTDRDRIHRAKLPLIVYGRRKTGKTFLVKKIFSGENYLFVKRDRTIYWENEDSVINYEELKRSIIREDGIFIIDEFHRLPKDFMDFLHIKAPQNVVLVTSTLWLAKRMLSASSPILGLFSECRLDIIDERDILRNLVKEIGNKKDLVEQSVYLREPILLRYFGTPLSDALSQLKFTIPALMGEIFMEEDREFSARYEGIVRAIASKKQTLTEITKFLHSNSLLPRQDSSLIKPYLQALLNMGIITRYPEFNSRRHRYFLSSPMMDMFYYLDEKYNFSERDLPTKYFMEKIPFHVEMFFRTLLGKLFDYRIFLYQKPMEVDIVMGDFKKIKLVAEVKWKQSIDKNDVRKIEDKLANFHAKKMMIVPDKTELPREPRDVEVCDPGDIVSMMGAPSPQC